MDKLYKNTEGTVILVDVCESITDATTLELRVKKPDGTLATWVGALEGLTFITYTVEAGDWDQDGTYLLQAYIETPTWAGLGETVAFDIEDDFK